MESGYFWKGHIQINTKREDRHPARQKSQPGLQKLIGAGVGMAVPGHAECRGLGLRGQKPPKMVQKSVHQCGGQKQWTRAAGMMDQNKLGHL